MRLVEPQVVPNLCDGVNEALTRIIGDIPGRAFPGSNLGMGSDKLKMKVQRMKPLVRFELIGLALLELSAAKCRSGRKAR
jgi:hypothetical protein